MPESISDLTARDLMTSSFVRVDQNESISKLLAALKRDEESSALVFDGKSFVGLSSDSSLLRNVDVTKTKVSTILRTVPTISPSESFAAMARLMRDGDVRVLPVMEKGKVIGVVSAKSLLARLPNHEVFSSLSAKDMASPNPLVVTTEDTLDHAIRLMKDSRVRKLPVVDAQRKPVGILRTEGLALDVLLSMNRAGKASFKLNRSSQSISKGPGLEVKVKSLMDENITVVSPSEKAKSVVKMLASQSNPAVLMANNGMTGIISAQSALDLFLNTKSRVQVSPIAITHIPDIDEIDRVNVEKMLQRTYDKVSRILKAEDNMHVVFKQTKKSQLRARTEVHITLSGVGRTLHAEAADWKVLLATKEACRALEAEVSKRFKRGSRGE